MNFFKKLFSRNSTQFYPQNYSIFGLNNKDITNYIAINTKLQILEAYNSCSTLKSIIDTKADVFSRGLLYMQKNETNIDNHFILDLLKNPHPLYSEKIFLKQFAKQIYLFDSCFILKNETIIGSPKSTKSLLILDAERVKIVAKSNINMNEIANINDIIDYYEYTTLKGTIERYAPFQVFFISTLPLQISNNEIVINHTLYTAEQPVNVIISAYDVRIGLNRKKGGFHILTKEMPKSDAIAFNNQNDSEAEAERVQQELSKYSYSSQDYNTLVTLASFKVQTLSFPIASMELNEGIRQAKSELCDITNFPLALLNNLEGTTFSNMEIADKLLYTKSIIPSWQLFENEFNRYFNLPEKIKIDFSHIESLQSDKKTELETKNIETNTIIELNQKIKDGIITKEIASYILINNYNYTEEEADLLLIENQIINTVTNE
jgi:hypothetical protein